MYITPACTYVRMHAHMLKLYSLDSILIFRSELDAFCESLAPLLTALVSGGLVRWVVTTISQLLCEVFEWHAHVRTYIPFTVT